MFGFNKLRECVQNSTERSLVDSLGRILYEQGCTTYKGTHVLVSISALIISVKREPGYVNVCDLGILQQSISVCNLYKRLSVNFV